MMSGIIPEKIPDIISGCALVESRVVERVDATAARAMRQILADQPSSDAKIRFAWAIVAGPAVSRASTVSFADGTLVVRTKSDSWFRAVERSRLTMLQRLTNLLGPGVVRTIVVANDDRLHSTLHHRP